MESNVKYADILVIALAVAYFIIGIINMFGTISAKIILLCSVVSFIVAIVQIMDLIAIYLRTIEAKIIKSSMCFYKAWCQKHREYDLNEINKKKEEYKGDWEKIHSIFDNVVTWMCRISNVALTITMIFFIIGLSTEFLNGNAILADTLTLFSFSIIFFSIIFQTYMERYVENKNKDLENILRELGE